MRPVSDTAWIIERATARGFDLCGVAPAVKFPELAQAEAWLAKGYAGEMKYLADPAPQRSTERAARNSQRDRLRLELQHSCTHKSIDAPDESDSGEPRGWISRYAWGDDYHDVLRSQTQWSGKRVAQRDSTNHLKRASTPIPALCMSAFSPNRQGSGWLGKNTLLLNQALGSWFFLGAVLTTLDLTPTLAPAESPPPDFCGSCTRCIDACPTDALVEPYVLDARRCISYLTIELRGSVPEDLREPIGRHVFGCDICQDVCPWNRRAPVTAAPEFQPESPFAISARRAQRWRRPSTPALDCGGSPPLPTIPTSASNLSSSAPRMAGRHDRRRLQSCLPRTAPSSAPNGAAWCETPASRSEIRHLVRRSGSHERISTLLQRLAASPDQPISESAHWALSRIQ